MLLKPHPGASNIIIGKIILRVSAKWRHCESLLFTTLLKTLFVCFYLTFWDFNDRQMSAINFKHEKLPLFSELIIYIIDSKWLHVRQVLLYGNVFVIEFVKTFLSFYKRTLVLVLRYFQNIFISFCLNCGKPGHNYVYITFSRLLFGRLDLLKVKGKKHGLIK